MIRYRDVRHRARHSAPQSGLLRIAHRVVDESECLEGIDIGYEKCACLLVHVSVAGIPWVLSVISLVISLVLSWTAITFICITPIIAIIIIIILLLFTRLHFKSITFIPSVCCGIFTSSRHRVIF